MPKSPEEKREDEVLLRMLKTKPKPHATMKGKPKASPGAPTTKAGRDAAKRADKTVIKRMRKR
jgi:hypothetical protein